MALIDIRLPDMDGTELLMMMSEAVPKTVKIIIRGYPSQENAAKFKELLGSYERNKTK